MSFQHKEGTGALFRNDQKGNQRAPRYRGELMINGTPYELAAWLKEGTSGTFFSLSAQVKDKRDASSITARISDVPF
jgi:hypothetical protein